MCYCMCQKREDAICRETDGVCAPAGMRGGGGGEGTSGKGGGAKTLGDGEQECEKRARRRSKQTTRLRNATATLQSRLSGWSCGAVTRFRDSKLCLWIPESFRPCNPLVPDVLLIPESCWFSGFPLGSCVGWWGVDGLGAVSRLTLTLLLLSPLSNSPPSFSYSVLFPPLLSPHHFCHVLSPFFFLFCPPPLLTNFLLFPPLVFPSLFAS